MSVRKDSLGRPCLSSAVASARVEINVQFHHYFDQNLVHGGCGRDLGIYIETLNEIFNRPEQVGDGIVARDHAVGYLVYSDVTSIRTRSYRKACTASRTPRPVCNALVGGNACRIISET